MYRRRGETRAVEESVEVLANAGEAARRFEVQWRLARSLFFLGQESESKPAKQQLHAAAIGAGERAVAMNADRVEGRFWLGVNLALLAEASRGLRAVRAILRARHELGRAAGISEGYHGAGPLRVLGRLHHKTPWFLGGSSNRSRRCFDRALKLAPDNSVTLVYAAEQAIGARDRERARSLLQRIIESPSDPEWEFENQRDREIATSMIERLRVA